MKVAITISGQTRSYNRDARDHLDVFMEIMNKRHGWTFDLYGIVWEDCEMPCDPEKFKVLETRNQQDLKDHIREHYSVLSSPIATKDDDPDLKDEWIEFIDSLPNQFEKEIEWSNRRLAQVWGAFEAVDLIDDLDEYDMIIRWRWDLGFYVKGVDNIMEREEGNNGIILDHYIDQMIEVLREEWEEFQERPTVFFAGFAKSPSIMLNDVIYLEDQFMIFNKMVCRAIQESDNFEVLRFNWNNELHFNRLGEHTLWTKIFYALGKWQCVKPNPNDRLSHIALIADLPRFLSYQP